MITLNDVAKKAKVGKSTVSRVLNNSNSVSKEAREKVLKAIDELDYHPSNAARSLKTFNSYNIGFIMDNTIDKAYANPFIYEEFRGIEKVIYENGYNMLLFGKDTYQNGILAVEAALKGKSVDGLILPSDLILSGYYEKLKKYNIPIVSLGQLENNFDLSWVDIDNRMAGYLATKYLYSRGYKNISFLGIDENKIFASERYKGYVKFLKEIGLEEQNFSETLQNIDSLVCLDNIYAHKALNICKNLNKDVPNEIGIITFDNYPLAEYLEPSITNIDINLFELGKHVGQEIIRKVKKKEGDIKNIKIPASVNIMNSTK